ncbi:CocE/NonD family hydrolase [Myceligenerans xiligouense]|uniref:Putative CocE/NonD family hydrolase n=1 Tax=Myceligenerans xiligouense TaxID=253184 RepID=A0A3N4YKK4_9MICO|nr:CocE/NonD family hydrolase [Myceligenerans xiligouense]RPF20617.1 putative CocE/NonD family hydrolase [Myceligenerans xiligouense]
MTATGIPHRRHVVLADGARLVGDLFPATGDRRGVAVVRTPYDARRHHPLAASLARQGYDCLVQDVRGRHRSDGAWTPYDVEGADGAATLADLREAGFDGPAVLYGASYAAHAALETARVAGPSLGVGAVVALVPALGLHETAYSGTGRPQYRDRIGWWARHGFGRSDDPPLSPDRLDRAAEVAHRESPVAAAAWLGWSDLPRRRAWHRLWETGPLDLAGRYGAVGVPLLVVTGDRDPFDHHARALAAAWGARYGPRAALLAGPWGHDLGIGTRDPRLRAAFDAAGTPGRRIAAWLAGTAGPEPGTTETLDTATRRWTPDTPGAAAVPLEGGR